MPTTTTSETPVVLDGGTWKVSRDTVCSVLSTYVSITCAAG